MTGERRLLVVDDEPVIGEACRRVFSRQGFAVETTTDPREGLRWAVQRDYVAVLLDIKMPAMDGVQFLRELRKTKAEMPVLIITGYPSVADAAAAVRLGASDYITKPFSPEEITQALQRVLARRGGAPEGVPPQPAQEAEPPPARLEGLLFFGPSWLEREADGSVRVGATLGPSPPSGATAQLTRIGEVLYQGLPMAAAVAPGQSPVTVPAPISGVVVGVNERLSADPSVWWTSPCRDGWLAVVSPTRWDEELAHCRPRRAVLANTVASTARQQAEQLTSLGCQVHWVHDAQGLLSAVAGQDRALLVFDAMGFGAAGPELVARVAAVAPGWKILVVAQGACPWQAQYRQHKIFYYAVEPFGDGEIAEIVNAAYANGPGYAAPTERAKAPSNPIKSITITNRAGQRVQLLGAPGLLDRAHGLGRQISEQLIGQALPVMVTPGQGTLGPPEVQKAAAVCDRLVVLVSKDMGRLPGSLVHDTQGDVVPLASDQAAKVRVLAIQPASPEAGLAGLAEATLTALAGHIVYQMTVA